MPPSVRIMRRMSSTLRWLKTCTSIPARTSSAAMSACRSEKPSTRSGASATMRSMRALVNADTRGFSRRARGGRTVKPEMPTLRLSPTPPLRLRFANITAFGGHHDLEPIVYEFFSPVGGAAATELTNRVVQFASHVSSGLVGSVGLALLAWTLVGTIKKVEDSFNFLWHVEQPRGFARRLAEYTSLLIAGPVLLVGFIGLSHAAFSSAPLQEMARLPLLHRLRGTGIALAPYVM